MSSNGTKEAVPAAPPKDSPHLEYRTIIQDSGDSEYVNRLLIATPTTGLVRIEWVQARYGQIIPTNWSMVQVNQYLNSFIPLRYQVADAQNIICGHLVSGDFQWLVLIEHDNLIPPDYFVRINEYIRSAEAPVVSGLYYTRSRPSEPILYRGRGTSFYDEWEMGDRVWVDGVPTGTLLIHGGLIRAMWEESEEYEVNGQTTRRIFDTPRNMWFDPESREHNLVTGTSDLDWCTRVMKEEFLAKAGWNSFQEKEFPFLVDTNIFCKHIDPGGEQFP